MYAKCTLAMFMDQCPQDWERVLRKNLTQNTMRNLEKVLEALRGGGGLAGLSGDVSRRTTPGAGTLGRSSRGRNKLLRRRTAPNRKTL